jgi:3-deoxy-manno-octulosonate cytidylyltransferase (CMP-KDO synthetase)
VTTPILGVIPARLASTRLPGKPLHSILGRPLLEWVWERVSAMELFHRVVVATESEEVLALCERMGAEVRMTNPDHPSGTDRVAEVLRLPEHASYEVVVNVQGDEPLVEESHLAAAVGLVVDAGWDLGTCATPLRSTGALQDPSVVKVARAADGRALYCSRAGIPFRRDGAPSLEEASAPPFLRHLGFYAYRKAALFRWVGLPPSPLEEVERLEQLRALEAGMAMGVAVVERAAPGVDTADDVIRLERFLSGGPAPLPSLESR